MEALINRIRHMLAYGMSRADICDTLKGEYDMSMIFLAFHAANLMAQWDNAA